MGVPLLDLKGQYVELKDELDEVVFDTEIKDMKLFSPKTSSMSVRTR